MYTQNPDSWGTWGEPWPEVAQQAPEVVMSANDAEYAAANGGLGHPEYDVEFETPSGDGAKHFFQMQAVEAERVRREAAAPATEVNMQAVHRPLSFEMGRQFVEASGVHVPHPGLVAVQRSFDGH